MSVYLKYLLETSLDNKDLEKRLNKVDYYSILGVNRDSSFSEIYANFKNLMEIYKPSFSLTDDFEKKALVYSFVLKSFSVLSNPVEREQYDVMLNDASNLEKIKFIKDELGALNIQDDELLGRIINLLGKSLNCNDDEISKRAKEDIVSIIQNIQSLLSSNYVVLCSNETIRKKDNEGSGNCRDFKYNVFDEQYSPEVIFPIDDNNKVDEVSSCETQNFISLLTLLKERIKKIRPKNKKDVFNYAMYLLISVMIASGFYLETERLKKEFDNFDYKQALTNIQIMLEELNEKTELTINYDITAEDTKKSLSKYSGISSRSFDKINEFDEGDVVSFVYTVSSRDLKKCSKEVVIGENDSQNIGAFCEKYNTNIQTLIYLNPELFGDFEDVDEYFISHPVMYRFSKDIDSLRIPDVELIKKYDVENAVVYQKAKKEV